MKILIILGGLSEEHKESTNSGLSCMKDLENLGHDVRTFTLSSDNIVFMTSYINTTKPDVILNTVMGKYGEDGCLQGIFELLGIPYTNSNVMASAIGMNKYMTKKIVNLEGIPVAKGFLINSVSEIEKSIKFPFILKPNNSGSSYRVKLIENQEDMKKIEIYESMMIEDYIPGKEITVAVFDNKVSSTIERIFDSKIYDHKEKYANNPINIIPANIDNNIDVLIKKYALKAYQAIGCSGLARIDFRYDPNRKEAGIFFLEINTQPYLGSLMKNNMEKLFHMTWNDFLTLMIEKAIIKNNYK